MVVLGSVSMAEWKTAVTPLLMHWSYCSLALSQLYGYPLYVESLQRKIDMFFPFVWFLNFGQARVVEIHT